MPTKHSLSELSPAQRMRLAYIEYRVWFFGGATRMDVLERFGVATAAGTRDMVLYRDLAPQNVTYEGKAYRYTPTFCPLFQHSVERVLVGLTSGFGVGEPFGAGELLPHAIPSRLNQPDLATLATVTRAIHNKHALELTYHSMKTGAVRREIVPHSLVDSGVRWHVRAYDRTKVEFRDLVLTRMEAVQQAEGADLPKSGISANERVEADDQWNKWVSLNLLPHPAHPHPLSISRDFGMQDGRLTVTLRAAMAGYVLRQWQVDCSPDARLRGASYRLWLSDTYQLNGVNSASLAPGFQGATETAPM